MKANLSNDVQNLASQIASLSARLLQQHEAEVANLRSEAARLERENADLRAMIQVTSTARSATKVESPHEVRAVYSSPPRVGHESPLPGTGDSGAGVRKSTAATRSLQAVPSLGTASSAGTASSLSAAAGFAPAAGAPAAALPAAPPSAPAPAAASSEHSGPQHQLTKARPGSARPASARPASKDRPLELALKALLHDHDSASTESFSSTAIQPTTTGGATSSRTSQNTLKWMAGLSSAVSAGTSPRGQDMPQDLFTSDQIQVVGDERTLSPLPTLRNHNSSEAVRLSRDDDIGGRASRTSRDSRSPRPRPPVAKAWIPVPKADWREAVFSKSPKQAVEVHNPLVEQPAGDTTSSTIPVESRSGRLPSMTLGSASARSASLNRSPSPRMSL